MTYSITNWNEIYESSESRKLKKLKSVLISNRHDGLGFRKMAAQSNACELMAAWVLLLQIASKSDVRGELSSGGRPMTPEDMSLITGFPEKAFKEALKFFSSNVSGWLTTSPGISGESPEVPAESPEVSGSSPTVLYSIVDKSIEENDTPPASLDGEHKNSNPKPSKAKGTLEEIKAFCKSVGLYDVDAEKCFYQWEGNGWINGKAKIKDWKATIRSWQMMAYLPSQKPGFIAPKQEDCSRYEGQTPIIGEAQKRLEQLRHHLETGELPEDYDC